MEEVSDNKKKLDSIVSLLHKCMECPVCLETVKHPFKVCNRGHVVCLGCSVKLEKCPVCREAITMENLVCVRSILEALPRFCRYSDAGCKDVVEVGSDHEMFCGYRPVICQRKHCSVTVPVVQILEHYRTNHLLLVIGADQEHKEETICYSLNSKFRTITFNVFDKIFWTSKVIDTKDKQFKLFFYATPIGKLEHDYYVRIELKKEREEVMYTYTLKAQVLSSCETKLMNESGEYIGQLDEEYCMRIPLAEMSNFKEYSSYIDFSYSFFKK